LVYQVGTNTHGPAEFALWNCFIEPETDFSSGIAPLLRNQKVKILKVGKTFTSIGNGKTVKAAFECNQGLEELWISCDDIRVQDTTELKCLFQGIAAVSSLRVLDLDIDASGIAVSPQEQGEMMFANALKECHNNSLEEIGSFTLVGDKSQRAISDREVILILRYNRERRNFQAQANGDHCQRNEQLVHALVAANAMENYHLHAWLVRYHAGEFCGLHFENEHT
jgi:hypothetical protein